MRGNSHKTVISVFAAAVQRWMAHERLTQQVAADRIVETHRHCGFDKVTGIDFHLVGGTASQADRAMQTNAERIWRWLDDRSKSSTLLPLNMLPTVLAALPEEIRLEVLTELLSPFGLSVTPQGTDEDESPFDLLVAQVKETGEANAAFARLCGGRALSRASKAELIDADRELAEGISAMQRAREELNGHLQRFGELSPKVRS